MKNFIKECAPFLLAAIVGCLFTVIFYIRIDIKNTLEPKQGDLLILGGDGAMELVKPGDIDTDTLYIVDGDSIRFLKSGYYNIEFTGTFEDTTTIVVLDSVYYTRKSTVSNINTKDLYKK